MMETTATVLSGERPWHVERADCLDFLAALPADSVQLVFGSPPYEDARTYGMEPWPTGQAWVDRMVPIYREALRVCTGLVAFVVEGRTKDYRWSGVPVLLAADLHREGIHLRKPPIYQRNGIPGSGGPDWLRNDYEFVVCATRGGPLPWSDNTACGEAPKYGPGGDPSHRKQDGSRVNERGWATRGHENGDLAAGRSYTPPEVANPGNVISGKAGGGHMGSDLAHENEAPFPQWLAEFFVRSFCPPGGVVCDPFSGSGTTGAAAVEWGRRFVGCDVRPCQVELTRRRLAGVTPMMFVGETA